MIDDLNRFSFVFEEKKYQIENFIICDNPVCDCHIVEFKLDDSIVGLDVNKRIMQTDNAKVDLALSKKVAEVLTDGQWDALLAIYHNFKFDLTDNISDFSKVSYDFSKLSLEEGNIFYDWIFPNAKPFMFEHEGQFFTVVDQYCLNPDCSCKDVYLSFYIVKETDYSQQPLMSCLFDYQKNTFSSIEENGPLDHKLIASFRQAKPNLALFYKKRHRGLRLMYVTYLEKIAHSSRAAATLPLLNIGRNDPCPCGSGKKYKKCCGVNK